MSFSMIISLCALAMTVITFVVGQVASHKAATKTELADVLQKMQACEQKLEEKIAQLAERDRELDMRLRENRDLLRQLVNLPPEGNR